MRAFITGISGFVGPYLARKLLSLGHEVYGLIRRRATGNKPTRLIETRLINDVKLIEGDVTDLTSLMFALDKSEPDIIFHLASQSYVPKSFVDPLETYSVNCQGTQNLLEAIRLKDVDCTLVFAGSSEEFGLQIASRKHYEWCLEKYKIIHPKPQRIPELPINEENPLRPMSPYAVSKVYGDFLSRNYFDAYGIKSIVSRAFNHEGAGRGHDFVTSSIVRQSVMLKQGEINCISIGNVNAFRDWSHVEDTVEGYVLLAEKGIPGEIYIQGSMRTNSVLTYILLTFQQLGYEVLEIKTLNGEKKVKAPIEANCDKFLNINFSKTLVDELMLKGELEYILKDKSVVVKTDKGNITIEFDPQRFRPVEVPILMSDTRKAQELGIKTARTLDDIIRDQINYYLNPANRRI